MEKQASVSEDIGCVVLELGYFIDFFGKGLQDPLSVALSLTREEQEERVKMFNQEIRTNYIYNAHKPSTKNYEKAMKIMGTDKTNTFFVGDQLFTDVWGAKRTGIHNILVRPINPKEEIQIVLKRYLEKIVLHFYKKRLKNERN